MIALGTAVGDVMFRMMWSKLPKNVETNTLSLFSGDVPSGKARNSKSQIDHPLGGIPNKKIYKSLGILIPFLWLKKGHSSLGVSIDAGRKTPRIWDNPSRNG